MENLIQIGSSARLSLRGLHTCPSTTSIPLETSNKSRYRLFDFFVGKDKDKEKDKEREKQKERDSSRKKLRLIRGDDTKEDEEDGRELWKGHFTSYFDLWEAGNGYQALEKKGSFMGGQVGESTIGAPIAKSDPLGSGPLGWGGGGSFIGGGQGGEGEEGGGQDRKMVDLLLMVLHDLAIERVKRAEMRPQQLDFCVEILVKAIDAFQDLRDKDKQQQNLMEQIRVQKHERKVQQQQKIKQQQRGQEVFAELKDKTHQKETPNTKLSSPHSSPLPPPSLPVPRVDLKTHTPQRIQELDTTTTSTRSYYSTTQNISELGSYDAFTGDASTNSFDVSDSDEMVNGNITKRVRLAGIKPIMQGDAEEKTNFLVNEWFPFLRFLRLELMKVQTRALVEPKPKILPKQKKILQMADKCFDLTEKWYGFGRGNISALYEWFITASEWSGESGYYWSQVPVERSKDGYVVYVDAAMRASLYGGGKKDTGKSEQSREKKIELLKEQLRASEQRDRARQALKHTEYIKEDGVPNHQVFETPIDNTVLSNLMSPFEARVLLCGRIVKEVMLFFVKVRQRRWLRWLQMKEGWAEPKEGEIVVSKFEKWSLLDGGKYLEEAGIYQDSFSFQALMHHGKITRSVSSLPPHLLSVLHNFVEHELSSTLPHLVSSPSNLGENGTKKTAVDNQLEDFLKWCKKHPGKLYENNAKKHKQLLLLGFLQNKFVIVKRSAMESVTIHRYIPVTWVRSMPLLTIEGDEERVVRAPGDVEHSRFRKNSFPYGDSHGMGIASGGLVEGLEQHGTLRYEFGACLGSDPEAKVTNWFLSDIEKICRECEILNPPAHIHNILPGEAYHDVGQNPQAASSIGATQHTQISRSCAEDWPIFRLSNNPMWVESLQAEIDLIQVGTQKDAFYLKFTTKHLTNPPLLQAVCHLRLHLMRKLDKIGGENSGCPMTKEKGKGVDFIIQAMPVSRSDGDFILVFQPISPLKKQDKQGEPQNDERNIDTGETWKDAHSPIPNGGPTSVHGSLLIGKTEMNEVKQKGISGRNTLEKLYDYIRKPGARKVVGDFLLRRYGYKGGKEDRQRDVIYHRGEATCVDDSHSPPSPSSSSPPGSFPSRSSLLPARSPSASSPTFPPHQPSNFSHLPDRKNPLFVGLLSPSLSCQPSTPISTQSPLYSPSRSPPISRSPIPRARSPTLKPPVRLLTPTSSEEKHGDSSPSMRSYKGFIRARGATWDGDIERGRSKLEKEQEREREREREREFQGFRLDHGSEDREQNKEWGRGKRTQDSARSYKGFQSSDSDSLPFGYRTGTYRNSPSIRRKTQVVYPRSPGASVNLTPSPPCPPKTPPLPSQQKSLYSVRSYSGYQGAFYSSSEKEDEKPKKKKKKEKDFFSIFK